VKPIVKLASAPTPDGKLLTLYSRDRDFFIRLDRQELMNSRENESEMELARLGCARIAGHSTPNVLIGGLGMGYTLRQTLDLLQPGARVVVAELVPEVVQWNRDFLGALTGHPLRDPRVELKVCDVVDIIRRSPGAFDAILLDTDNGPAAMTTDSNDRLYNRHGVQDCSAALTAKGCLAIWAADMDPSFEGRLQQAKLHFRACRVATHKGGRGRTRCIWIASQDRNTLPPR